MADYSDPKRAVAYRFTLSLFARSDNQIKTVPTLAAGDVKVSKDNGATANITTLPAETPASSGILQVDLDATEMTADLVTVIFRDAAGDEWNDVSVNIAPSAVQMGDLATAANLATVDTVVDAILVDTAEIGAAGAGLTALATQASVNTIDDFLDTEIASIVASIGTVENLGTGATLAKNLRDMGGATFDSTTDTIEAVRNTLVTVEGYVDTEVAAIKAKTDLIPAAPAAVGDIPTANANADALLDRAAGVETGYTLRQAQRIMLSALAGKASGLATTTAVFRDVTDTKNRISATVDADGNRSAVTLDGT